MCDGVIYLKLCDNIDKIVTFFVRTAYLAHFLIITLFNMSSDIKDSKLVISSIDKCDAKCIRLFDCVEYQVFHIPNCVVMVEYVT